VATYAYVNPVVAVFLGWLILGEQVTLRTVVAGIVIVAAVALIISAGGTGRRDERFVVVDRTR
jgi:drug/metabolite transporter (DMT)-like permease